MLDSLVGVARGTVLQGGGKHMAPWAPAFRGDLTGELPGTNRFYGGFQMHLEEYVF